MKKAQQILTLVLSLGFLAVFAALFWILPDADESTVERRHLAKSPALSFSSVANGSFMNDFENYMLDQFPLRDGFRTLKAAANAKVFMQMLKEKIRMSADRISAAEKVTSYQSLTKLTPELAKELIKRILVRPDKSIRIEWNFSDELSGLVEFPEICFAKQAI